MPKLTIDDIPPNIFQKILSFTSSWDFINAAHVSKSWRDKLMPAFQEFEQIYQSLIEQESEAVVLECLKSLKITRSVFMSKKLIQKLTLDEIITIACNSYAHAEIVFKSQLFHTRPIFHKEKALKEFFLFGEEFFEEDDDLSLCYLFQDLIPLPGNLYTFLKTRELIHKDVIPAEWNKPNTSIIFLGQAYIARAITKENANYINLAVEHARRVFSAESIIKIASVSTAHTKAILNINTLKSQLNANLMAKISSLSSKHKQIVFEYVINLISRLPVQLTRVNPTTVKTIALSLIGNTFYQPTNLAWVTWLKNKPELANHILEARKMLNRDKSVSFILMKLMGISITHAKEILSIPNIEKWLINSVLNSMALKDQDYNLLINNFLSQKIESSFDKNLKF